MLKISQCDYAIARSSLLKYSVRQTTIAAVNGPAVGMGMDIALACDIRIASEAGRFAYLYVRRGI